MQPEKRKYKRTDIFLIIHFRLIHNSYEYAIGISRNYSDDGFSIESHSFDYKPGQLMECTIRHPGSKTSVSILGQVVWKKEGWYDAVMGIKFLHISKNNLKAIRELAVARQKESVPVLSEDTAFSTAHDNNIQDMITHDDSFNERKINIPFRSMHSKKLRRSYFRFFVFLVFSAVLIFSIAARDGKDVFRWESLSEWKSDSALPGQNHMAVDFSPDDTSAIIGNDRGLIPAEKTWAKALSTEAALPKEIIRDEITFAVNSAAISSKFYSLIDGVADILLGNPKLIVKLEGHTDNAGSAIYNMDLSMRRAAAVRSELMNKGILSSRIQIICFGPSSPTASNDIESGRMKNRRVEIAIPFLKS